MHCALSSVPGSTPLHCFRVVERPGDVIFSPLASELATECIILCSSWSPFLDPCLPLQSYACTLVLLSLIPQSPTLPAATGKGHQSPADVTNILACVIGKRCIETSAWEKNRTEGKKLNACVFVCENRTLSDDWDRSRRAAGHAA